MKVEILDMEENRIHKFVEVEMILNITDYYTLCEELKNSILIVHSVNHCEKYRLLKNAKILKVEKYG